MESVLILSFAVAFLVSVVDYFRDLGILRAAIALGLSLIGVVPFEQPWYVALPAALASAFLAMGLLQLIERLNYRPPGRIR